MRNLLIRLAWWILLRFDAIPKPIVLLPPLWMESTQYLPVAKELCQSVDSVQQSGEFKRHKVYAAMIKEFPSANRVHLAMAIERAVGGGE